MISIDTLFHIFSFILNKSELSRIIDIFLKSKEFLNFLNSNKFYKDKVLKLKKFIKDINYSQNLKLVEIKRIKKDCNNYYGDHFPKFHPNIIHIIQNWQLQDINYNPFYNKEIYHIRDYTRWRNIPRTGDIIVGIKFKTPTLIHINICENMFKTKTKYFKFGNYGLPVFNIPWSDYPKIIIEGNNDEEFEIIFINNNILRYNHKEFILKIENIDFLFKGGLIGQHY